MGRIFFLLSPKDEHQEQEYLAYMKQEGLAWPNDDFKFGRLPTYAEFKQILSRLPQYTVQDNGGDIYLFREGEEVAALRVPLDNRPRNDASLMDFYWKYTSEPLMPLFQEITNLCGSMVIGNDCDLHLIFVHPQIQLEP